MLDFKNKLTVNKLISIDYPIKRIFISSEEEFF